LVIEGEVRHQALQAAVFILELAQTAHFGDLEPAVFGLPPIERLLAEAVPPAEVQCLGTRRRLFQHANDLLFGEPLALHAPPSRRVS